MSLINCVNKFGNFLFGKTLGNVILRSSSTLPSEIKKDSEIIDKVKALAEAENSRNFAIIHVLGKQFKVTDGDMIVLEGYWAPTIGDEISFNKVLLAGSRDYSLIGTPLVQSGLVNVKGTIIGKRLSHIRPVFKFIKRKRHARLNFVRTEQTTVRINSVQIGSHINP